MSETTGLMIGKIVRIIRDLNRQAAGINDNNPHFLQKNELCIITHQSGHDIRPWNCTVQSLDGKRSSVGLLAFEGDNLDNCHFELIGDSTKAIKVLFEE